MPKSGAMQLTLHLTRRVPLPGLAVALRLPPGVRVVAAPDLSVLQQTQTAPLALTWRLWLDAVPKQDAVAVLSLRSAGAGVHAQVPYRFGRPEPKAGLPGRTRTATGKRWHSVQLR